MRRFISLVVVAVLSSACQAPRAAPGAAGSAPPAQYRITYRVIGGPGVHAAISWTTADGQVAQEADVLLPWTATLEVAPGTQLSLTGQSLDQSLVTCSIEVGGLPMRKATGGRSEPATCSLRTP